MKATSKQAATNAKVSPAVRRYLTETGLALEDVIATHRLEVAPLGPHARERLTAGETKALAGIERTLESASAWVVGLALKSTKAQTRAVPRPALLPVREAKMLEKALDALLDDSRAVRLEGGGVNVWLSALAISPTLGDLAARQKALYDKCILTPAELRERIAARLTGPDGRPAITPAEWCTAQGENFSRFIAALYETWFAIGTQRLEEELAKERKRGKLLPDRAVLPGTLVDNGFRPEVQARHLQEIANETLPLFEYDDDAERVLAEMRIHAELKIPQLAALDAPQQRALLAVYRLATPGEVDAMLRDWFEVPAGMLWQAMGLERPSDAVKRRHLAALRALGDKQLHYTATVEQGNRRAVEIGKCPPYTVAAKYLDTKDGRKRSVAALEKDWEANRGRIPDTFRFEIPLVMRKTARRLVLSGNVLSRLDAGAKAARGPLESFEPLDFALFLKITQTVQHRHGGRSYVDVAQLLREHYLTPAPSEDADALAAMTAEERKKAADKREYAFQARRKKGKYAAQYEKAVAVLEAGELARRISKGQPTKDGTRRDVFELLPDNVLNRIKAGADAPTLPGL